MYAWLWRALPDRLWLRLLVFAALFAAVAYVCLTWAYPAALEIVQNVGSGTGPNQVGTG